MYKSLHTFKVRTNRITDYEFSCSSASQNRCLHVCSVVSGSTILMLASNEEIHKVMNEFEFQPDQTTDHVVT